MTATIGRSLELYYIDGRPDGMLTAELFNWTGHVLMTPRTHIATALKRSEASSTGVYILIGKQLGESRAYVGEGEDISARIRAHDTAKDWWTSAVLVTTNGNKLNKAHVRYLEARLINQARSIGRVLLDNGTTPPLPALSEADVAKMEAFLQDLFMVLPAVRVDIFTQRSRPAPKSEPPRPNPPKPTSLFPGLDGEVAPVHFVMEVPRNGVHAKARLENGEFIVETGSRARARWEGTDKQGLSYAPLHQELIRAGILQLDGEYRVFTQDYVFRSPSAAAAVVAGRSANGPVTSHLQNEGISYKEWEARQLAATGARAP